MNRKTIGWLSAVLLPLIILLLPTSTLFPFVLKHFLMITVFVIVIIAFELLPQMVAAFMLPCLYWITGLVPAQTAFESWSSTTVWIVLGGLVFSTVLDDCGLLRRIAYAVILRCGGTYKGAVWGCFVIGIILNVITFCNGWLVASALVYGVCQAMGLKPSKESALICFAGIAGASGPTVLLYYPGYFTIIEDAVRHFIPDYTMGIFDTFIYNGAGLAFFAISIAVMIHVYGVDHMQKKLKRELFEEKYKELGPMTVREKKAALLTALLLLYLFSTTFTGLHAVYGFAVIPILMFLPGIEAATAATLQKVNLSVVFFVAACLGIGVVGAEVGFGDFLSAVALPVLQGRGSLFACLVFLFFGIVANLFMTPYAMLGGLSLSFAQIAVSLGMNPVGVIMVLLWSCEILFLPYQSAGYMIMYGYGLMPMKHFITQVGLKSAVMILGFITILFPIWNFFEMI